MRSPTIENFRYGPYTRNVLDLYVPETTEPAPVYVFIHGGGFRGGRKESLHQILREQLPAAGIAVVAVEYRLSDVACYPAAMLDGMRAVQTLRARAGEWGLDKTRLAAGGGSAGSGITFWIGFGPERAEPESDDPVARESTRLTCIASWQAQTSYHPDFIRSIISGECCHNPALEQFFGVTAYGLDTPEARRMFDEVNFIEHASAESPPVFLWYKTPNLPMKPDLPLGPGIHHPKFGLVLKERLDALGVECELHRREDRPELEDEALQAWFFKKQIAFLIRHLIPGGRGDVGATAP